MEGVRHRTVPVNGISMHVAEKGEGPVVLLLHGFPELWYSWRHQIAGLASRGYRAVAPDLRGYGDTEAPASPAAYSVLHLVGDVVALIDSLGQDKVFVVGHDWGAIVAWNLCLFRPDRVKALVNLSVPFRYYYSDRKPVESMRALFGDKYYICKFQEPGAAEAEFSQLGTRFIMRKFLADSKPDPNHVSEFQGSGSPSGDELPLPPWLSEEDIHYYASKFEKSGFTGGLNYYRSMDLNWELTAPWAGSQVKVPTMFMVGDLDLVYHMPGVQEYIHKGGFQRDVPFLQDVVVMESVGHFINQERGPEVSDHIYNFIKKFQP
ncbi:unnamed protein product [Spirodela intermedia]|uniref:soluble epoxide hydrolase n=1 Tax=Spirodela intermedia TaxID=51605 RepID=A0A7I8JZG9_SPIIN|nr:unnamed protein product [Spirodela intermedia]